MKLSISLISEKLSAYITFKKCNSYFNIMNLNRPEHYFQQNILQNNHLYVATLSNLPNLLTGESESCLICIGNPPEEYFIQKFSIICVSENLDIFLLFNMIQKIYDKYDLWDQHMQQCINAHSDLQDIVNVSDSIFQNPIYLCDSDYRILAGPRNDPQNIKYTYIPQRFINNFKYDPIYHKMWQSDVPIICQGDLRDDRHLCLIVRSQGQFAVFVSVIETNTPFRDSDSILLQHMSYYILLHFEQNLLSNENKSFSLEYFMKQYLNQKQISRRAFENTLALFNWKENHIFYLYYIELTEPDLHYNTIKYQCDQIKKIFSSIIVFEYNYCIIAIVNYSMSNEFKANESCLYQLLKNNGFKAGISREFNNISNVRNYYIQAFSALELGKITDSNRNHYKFEDYCLDYMLKNSYKNLTPESLCPNGLLEMREYDRAHNTEYIQTLKSYFEEKFNVTHAAKKMYIHRTTFIDRLERIKNFLGMNLEDPRICLYLMISLEIIR